MAIDAENTCFNNMGGFGSFTIPTPQQDCYMGSGFGIQDDLGFFPRMGILQDTLASSSSSSSMCSVYLPLDIVQSLSCELERQRMEMDWYLQMENQRMTSCVFVEQRRQREIIMQKYESNLKSLILHKDQQVAAARNRAKELRNSLQIAEMESKAWQKEVTEKEATLSYLRNKLKAAEAQQLETASSSASSFLESQQKKQEESCKLCNTRSLCCVFLPCRHLCCCNECEGLLGHCPVCGTVKEASLEVFLA